VSAWLLEIWVLVSEKLEDASETVGSLEVA